MNTRDLALRAIVVKYIADVTKSAIAARREDLADAMANGDRVSVTDPEDPEVSLGKVWRTETKGGGVVTDREKFTAWMAQTYPDRVETVATVTNLQAAVEVLQRHAPHLVATTTVVSPWAENEVLLATGSAKQACGPGGELDVPGVDYEAPGDGVVTVKLSPDAPAAIARMWRDGRIDLNTGEVLALEAAP